MAWLSLFKAGLSGLFGGIRRLFEKSIFPSQSEIADYVQEQYPNISQQNVAKLTQAGLLSVRAGLELQTADPSQALSPQDIPTLGQTGGNYRYTVRVTILGERPEDNRFRTITVTSSRNLTKGEIVSESLGVLRDLYASRLYGANFGMAEPTERNTMYEILGALRGT